MITLIEGGFFSGAHERIVNEIRTCVLSGRRAYLLVPEQQTVIAEAEMAELLPASAPLTFEVTNFTRLANTVFRTVGGTDATYCDRTRKALIMWRTLTELSPVLGMTGGKEANAGTVERALSAVGQMESAGIDSVALAEALEALGADEGRLRSKLSDLSSIMSLYKRLISERYSDAADDVGAVAALIKTTPSLFSDACIFIEGFTSFTEGQYELIALLARSGELTVHLNLPRGNPDAFEYGEIAAARRRILTLCDRYAVEKRLVRLDGCEGNEYIAECIRLLWRTDAKIDNNTLHFNNDIEIIECPTPLDECDYIAADIRGRVKSGAQFRDFAIVARHAEKYVGVLDLALDKARVPYFYSRAQSAEGAEPIKLIYTALAVISRGFRREDVISYAKCTPTGVSRDACDEFELYCEMWGIDGTRFTDGEAFNMNPDGYTVRHSSDMGERLAEINRTRDALISPLLSLEADFRGARTVREFATALVDFLIKTDMPAAIRAREAELAARGEAALAEEYSALWDIIVASLDTLVECVGDSPATLDSFTAQLRVTFANAHIGKIPSFCDTVAVGSADMIRLHDKKHIYIIGVNRGEFPENTPDGAYFTERDKSALSALGLTIDTDAAERGAREMYVFLRAMSYARESVSVLYTTKSTRMAEAAPSEIVGRLISLCDGALKVKKMTDRPAEDYVYTPERALESIGRLAPSSAASVKDALAELGYSDKVSISEGVISNDSLYLTRDTLSATAGGALALTQSRIDDYNSCPLLYFLRYDLALRPEERAEFDARNIGSFIHAILESFFGEVAEKSIPIGDIDSARAEEMVERAAKGYLSALEEGGAKKTKREEVLLSRLCRAAMPVVKGLCEEFAESSFVPRYFELKLENGDENLPEPARFKSEEGGEVYVYGTIDRVDTCKIGDELYVRVVDYKTGKKDFSPSDIEKGKNLQMFLYLKSVVDTKNEKFLLDLGAEAGHRPIPAGVVYVKTEVGDVKIKSPDAAEAERVNSEAQKRKGMILAEAEVINATGARFCPVRILKSGAIHGSDLQKAYTREGWEEITATIGEVVGSIAAGIRRGRVCATPSDSDACTYCKFKPFCRSCD